MTSGLKVVAPASKRTRLLHRLRRHRDTISPDKYHSCHPGCLNVDCLIVSALKFIEDETHGDKEKETD